MTKFSNEQIAQIKEIVAQAIAAANSCKCNAISDDECSDKAVAPRPLGVWCLTENYRAIKPTEWEKQNNGEQCIGIGVVTDKTAYIVSLMPTPSLPLGSTKVTEYPDICCDKETYDNEAVTEAFLEAQTSCEEDVFYWGKDKRFPYRDCPAIDNLPAPIMSSFGTITWVLPTLATMKDIASRIGDINAAIFAVGGIVVSPYYHWTCTVKQDNKECAFIVNSDDGNVDDDGMNGSNDVRAVSAFHFENFKFKFLIIKTMEVNIILEESAFIVEADGKKLRVSYKEECLPYKKARKFCEENGGGDETVENLRFLAKHRDAINKVLEENGRTELSGLYWSNEESWRYEESAFIVDSGSGDVYYRDTDNDYNVRAVSAL